MNASKAEPVQDGLSRRSFGAWLRASRQENGKLQRELASAAAMDSSHLGKVERGERLPTKDQVLAFARFLRLNETEVAARYAAVRIFEECGGNASVLHAAGGMVKEAAEPYIVNKSVNSRAKKK